MKTSISGKICFSQAVTTLLIVFMLLQACSTFAGEPAQKKFTRGDDAAGSLRPIGQYSSYPIPVACDGRPPNATEIYPEAPLSKYDRILPPAQFVDGRNDYSITKIANGTAIVAGGIDQRKQPIASVRIWDPAAKR